MLVIIVTSFSLRVEPNSFKLLSLGITMLEKIRLSSSEQEQNQNTFIPKKAMNNIQVPGMALRSNAGLPTPSELN